MSMYDVSAHPCVHIIILWAITSTLNESTFHIFLFSMNYDLRSIIFLATKARTSNSNNDNNNSDNNNDDSVVKEFWNSTFYCNQFQIIFLGFSGGGFSFISWVWSVECLVLIFWADHFSVLLIHHWNAIQFIFLILSFTILRFTHNLRNFLFHYIYINIVCICEPSMHSALHTYTFNLIQQNHISFGNLHIC